MSDGNLKTPLVITASVAVGVVIGSVLPQPAAPAAASETPAVDQQWGSELVAELRSLRELLARERSVIPIREAVSSPSVATPATLDPAVFESFFAALDERLAQMASSAGRFAQPVAPPNESFEPRPFPVREEISTRDFSKRHLFWSYQQVVDAYGLADTMSINPHGEHIWGYQHGDATLEFVFHEGYVARVEW